MNVCKTNTSVKYRIRISRVVLAKECLARERNASASIAYQNLHECSR